MAGEVRSEGRLWRWEHVVPVDQADSQAKGMFACKKIRSDAEKIRRAGEAEILNREGYLFRRGTFPAAVVWLRSTLIPFPKNSSSLSACVGVGGLRNESGRTPPISREGECSLKDRTGRFPS